MSKETINDAAVAALATKASYATSAATVIAGFTIGELAGLIGIGATLATFVANIYFRWRADQREEREHRLRVAELKAEFKAEHNANLPD
jgi:hypothetical protein